MEFFELNIKEMNFKYMGNYNSYLEYANYLVDNKIVQDYSFEENDLKDFKYEIEESLLAYRNANNMYYIFNTDGNLEPMGIFSSDKDFNDFYDDENLDDDTIFVAKEQDLLKLIDNIEIALNSINITENDKVEITNYLDNFNLNMEEMK